MKHPQYGNLPHIYYNKVHYYYYVRFSRRGQYFVSPYYKTVEEAIKARNVMQHIVPKSESGKRGRVKICDYETVTWKLEKYLSGEEQYIDNRPLTNLEGSKAGAPRYKNRKGQQAKKDR